jgi:adenylate cyclase
VPEEFAEKILESKVEEVNVMKSKNDASVLVLDLFGFTKVSSKHSASDLVDYINDLYSELDNLCKTYGLEKVKIHGNFRNFLGHFRYKGQIA